MLTPRNLNFLDRTAPENPIQEWMWGGADVAEALKLALPDGDFIVLSLGNIPKGLTIPNACLQIHSLWMMQPCLHIQNHQSRHMPDSTSC